MKKIFILFLYLYSLRLFAFSEEFFLSAGPGFSEGSVKSRYLIQQDDDEDEIEDETKIPAIGLTSRFGFRSYPLEMGILSDIGFGKAENIRFNESQEANNNTLVEGDGHYRIVTISPYLKHNFPWKYRAWNAYIGGGPSWSLNTLVIKNVNNGSNFNTKKRVSFENFGAGIFVGVEEILPFKEMHPTFIEFGYSYMASYKVSVIDASDFKEVQTLSSRKGRDFRGSFFFLRLGVVLF